MLIQPSLPIRQVIPSGNFVVAMQFLITGGNERYEL